MVKLFKKFRQIEYWGKLRLKPQAKSSNSWNSGVKSSYPAAKLITTIQDTAAVVQKIE